MGGMVGPSMDELVCTSSSTWGIVRIWFTDGTVGEVGDGSFLSPILGKFTPPPKKNNPFIHLPIWPTLFGISYYFTILIEIK